MPPAPEPAAAATPAVRTMDAVVVDSVRRTRDTVSLYLFVGDPGPYRAGQFVTIDPHQFYELKHWVDYLEEQKGKRELPRAYSLQSSPGEKCLSICVQAEGYDRELRKYPPLLSPFLVASAFKGRELQIAGYSGVYVLQDDVDQHTDEVLHVVAGAGVAPSYSIVKDELKNQRHARVRHTMVLVNHTIACRSCT
jgi:ferredoxin-NADP reductase